MGGVAAAPPGRPVPHRPAIWGPAASLAGQHWRPLLCELPSPGGVAWGEGTIGSSLCPKPPGPAGDCAMVWGP